MPVLEARKKLGASISEVYCVAIMKPNIGGPSARTAGLLRVAH